MGTTGRLLGRALDGTAEGTRLVTRAPPIGLALELNDLARRIRNPLEPQRQYLKLFIPEASDDAIKFSVGHAKLERGQFHQ